MRAAAESVSEDYRDLRDMVGLHADDEQYDFDILFRDYRRAGGTVASIDSLKRNPGGEALNAYLHARAREPDPVGLLGAIYVIEGTGQRIVPALLPLIRRQIGIAAGSFRFLQYHGANDAAHLQRWLGSVRYVMDRDASGNAARAIAATARDTAALYLMQMEHIG